MSAVQRLLKGFGNISPSAEQQRPLDFLYVKKPSKGFSACFWSLMGVVSSVYIALMLHWHGADFEPDGLLSVWQYRSETTSQQDQQQDQQQPLLLATQRTLQQKKQPTPKPVSTQIAHTSTEMNSHLLTDTSEASGIKSTVSKTPTPKQLLSEIEQAKASQPARLTAGHIQRQPKQPQQRFRSKIVNLDQPILDKATLDKPTIQISSPQYQQLYEAAIAASESGRVREANRLIDEALYLKPTQEAHILKLRLLLLSSVQDVIPYIYKHQLSILDSHELLAIYAQANQRSGHYENAQWAYQKLLQAEPSHEGWFLGLALSLEHQGNIEQAVHHYHQAIQLTRDNQLKHFAKQRVSHLQSLLP